MSLMIRTIVEHPGPAAFRLDVNLEIPDRGITAVFGPSGCGKSTLLRCVAGLEHSSRGRIALGDRVWQDEGVFESAHRRGAALVFQDGALFDHLDVRRNLEYGKKRASNHAPDLDDVTAMLGLEGLLDRTPHGLSGGERQRVALGRALLAGPDLLLLDEPLASIDRAARHAIYPYLETVQASTGLPMLYVTHSLDEAARLADHMIHLEAGRMKACGPLAALMTDLDGDLSRGPEGGAVLTARVVGHEPEHHLSRLAFDGGEILMPVPDLETDRRVRLRIHARDISLALQRPHETSILNILPARVDGLAARRPGRMMVRLSVGHAALLAAITERSADQLGLEPGREVFAQIKSVALL